MNLRNCSRCGKMFNYIAGPIMCENCKKELEEDFQKVKKYITDNPTASLKQITDDNNVKTSQIREWIREERLMFAKFRPGDDQMAVKLAPHQLIQPAERAAVGFLQHVRAFGAQTVQTLARRKHADGQIRRKRTGAVGCR